MSRVDDRGECAARRDARAGERLLDGRLEGVAALLQGRHDFGGERLRRFTGELAERGRLGSERGAHFRCYEFGDATGRAGHGVGRVVEGCQLLCT